MLNLNDPKVVIVIVVVIALFLFYQQRMLQSQIGSLRDFLLGAKSEGFGTKAQPQRPLPPRASPLNNNDRLARAQQIQTPQQQSVEPQSVFQQPPEDEFEDDSSIEKKYSNK